MISLLAAVAFGSFPALEATAIDLRSAVAEASRSGTASRRQRKRQLLVFAEVALFSAFAGLAILLCALGVYGLIAQSVAQRTREFGIRLALGASTKNIIRTAVLPGVKLSVAGIACGIVISLFATRLLKSLIWGITTTDATTFVTVSVLLIAVAVFASLIPALRLLKLDPAQTLRDE